MPKKLYGKGHIRELVKGKKYRIEVNGGKDPLSERVYSHGQEIPGDAYALDEGGEPVRPRVVYGDATDEQKEQFDRWKTPARYIRRDETFLGTKRQAEIRANEIRLELETGKRPDADKVTFADWCERYLSMREGSGKYRPKTLKQDRSQSKHLLRHLGGVLVVDISPAVIDETISALRKDRVGDTTVKQSYKLLKRILKYAVDNDLIPVNPAERAEAPKNPKPQRRALDAGEAARLSGICTSGTPTAKKTAVYLALATGARLGEILGLTWGHVELEGPRPFVHIMQQFASAGEIAPIKTDRGDNPAGRVVPIDAATVAALVAWRAEQRRLLNSIGIEPGPKTPVVTSREGGFTDHSSFHRWWRTFCVGNGFGRFVADDGRTIVELTTGDDPTPYPASGHVVLWRDSDGWPCDENGKRYSRSYKGPEVRRHYEGLHFHELRHTHFTLRLASGMDIPTAQALGGWTTPDVLLRVYAHATPENVWASAGFMDALEGASARKSRGNRPA